MKHERSLLLVPLLVITLSPLFAIADTNISGGFPESPLWLSKSSLIDGDAVQISTPVYNAGTAKISGDAVFTVDESEIGTAHFELVAGESKIVSAAWKATEGTHTLKARMENASDVNLKQAVSLDGNVTGEISVEVAPAPPQPAIVQAISTATGAISNATAAALPVVASVGGIVFKETEQIRKSAVTSLENSLAGTENSPATDNNTESQGTVLSATTYRAPSMTASAASAPASSGLMRVLQTILLFLVSYVWIFYPLLILLMLAILYLLGKGLSRTKGSKRS